MLDELRKELLWALYQRKRYEKMGDQRRERVYADEASEILDAIEEAKRES